MNCSQQNELQSAKLIAVSKMNCCLPAFFGRFDDKLVHIDFYAQTSCLNIKANGKSYNLSNDLVNKLCDQSLDTHIIAYLTGKINQNKEYYQYTPTSEKWSQFSNGRKNKLINIDEVSSKQTFANSELLESSHLVVWDSPFGRLLTL